MASAGFSVMVALEVYGSLAMLTVLNASPVQYQTLSAVSMLTSIGIAVEFVAHPVAAFEYAGGSARSRLVAAYAQTGLPVILGFVSSVLGFVFLAFSDFDFVFKYFFLIYLMICIFGAINGLVFLPACLGLFGQCASDEGSCHRGEQLQIKTTITTNAPNPSLSSSSTSSSIRKLDGVTV